MFELHWLHDEALVPLEIVSHPIPCTSELVHATQDWLMSPTRWFPFPLADGLESLHDTLGSGNRRRGRVRDGRSGLFYQAARDHVPAFARREGQPAGHRFSLH